MMKSSNNQVEVDISESSTKTEEVFLPEIVDNKDEKLSLLPPQRSLQEKMAFTFPQNRKIQVIHTFQDQTTNTKGK